MDTMSVDVAAAHSTAPIADSRDRTRAFLDGLVRPIGEEAVDTVVLVVSELVTNALRHACGTCTLDLAARPPGQHRGGRPRPESTKVAHAHP
jgi:hypothetical protein